MTEAEAIRQKLIALENRAEELSKKMDRLVGKVDQFDPEVKAFTREGLPLEIYMRRSLIESGYDVHGYYPYHLLSANSPPVERSIDLYASRDYVYTVPQDGGTDSGQSWPERDNLLVEAKQRKSHVKWLFCSLPKTTEDWSIAGKDVPVVNAGFELRPTETGFQSSPNAKDVKNAIAQLNEVYIPFLVDRQTQRFGTRVGRAREHTWLLLVTNATLRCFNPEAHLETLLSENASQDEVFRDVPWLVYKPELSLNLLTHQRLSVEPLQNNEGSNSRSTAEIMSDHSHEVHVVQHTHLSEFLALVKDPPRLKQINITVAVQNDKSNSTKI